MKVTNITKAKAQLSRLVDRALLGDDVVIARAGRPLVRLVPVHVDTTTRDLSRAPWEGRVRVADDVDELPKDVMDGFEGEVPT